MTSYQQTLPHSSPLRLAPIDRRSLSRGLTVTLAALIAVIVLAVSIELTMGYRRPLKPVRQRRSQRLAWACKSG